VYFPTRKGDATFLLCRKRGEKGSSVPGRNGLDFHYGMRSGTGTNPSPTEDVPSGGDSGGRPFVEWKGGEEKGGKLDPFASRRIIRIIFGGRGGQQKG